MTSTAEHVFDAYREHNTGHRVHTDTVIQPMLREHYPDYLLTSTICDLLKYAEAGHAFASPLSDGPPPLRVRAFEPTTRQQVLAGDKGKLKDLVSFGMYDYIWGKQNFKVFVLDGQNGLACEKRCYVLKLAEESACEAIDELILAAHSWAEQISDEIWVFDQGQWSKDKELFKSIQDADLDQIILDETMKFSIMRDVVGFFGASQQYAHFGTPWKRGLIFHGTPGNGKTMTLKAIMKTLMSRPEPIPTLYVKTFSQRRFGPQHSVRQIFLKARQSAPCLLLFEDVDSLVSKEVRSYFLNEVDGLENNNGILMIGSTNNLDLLDPGLSKRPSRFDRKYRFRTPSYEERLRYCDYWRSKIADNSSLHTNADVPSRIASITEGFSFAYLKEAYLASLLTLIRESDGTDAPEDGKYTSGKLAQMLESQVEVLRIEMAEAEKSEAERERDEKSTAKRSVPATI